jgi:hypothetical protein
MVMVMKDYIASLGNIFVPLSVFTPSKSKVDPGDEFEVSVSCNVKSQVRLAINQFLALTSPITAYSRLFKRVWSTVFIAMLVLLTPLKCDLPD